MKEKISYDDLVRRINAGLNGTTLYHDAFGAKPGKPLQEVNAWTYWQGYKVRNPKVMIVGQDWGSLGLGFTQLLGQPPTASLNLWGSFTS